MYQTDPPLPAKKTLPTMYDLKSEDPEEPGLPDEFHLLQPELLRLTFRPVDYDLNEVFVASDLNLYYDPRHTQWYKRPDWFAALGVSRLYEEKDLRLSYVTWQEGVNPFIVIELLSPGTEGEDLGTSLREINQPPTKWQVYERILRIPYYAVFDRRTNQLRLFGLITSRYQELTPQNQGYWLEEIKLGLGLWSGSYQGITRQWLRWYDGEGNWLLTPEEMADQRARQAQQQAQEAEQQAQAAQQQAQAAQQQAQEAQQQAQEAQQQAQAAQQQAQEAQEKAAKLAQKLRDLGIDPDNL